MKFSIRMESISVPALCALALLASGRIAGGQSFSSLRGGKKMIIKRLLPPAVNLNRKRIGVASEAQGGAPPAVAAVLKTRVLTAIQKDPNFVVDDKNPETRLSFMVTEFRVERQQVQSSATNPPTTCTVFVGRADVSYQAIDVATGVPQDSENLSSRIDLGKGRVRDSKIPGIPLSFPRGGVSCEQYGKLTESAATDELYDDLVHQMTQRAAPVDEEVEVALPGGKLKDLSLLALDKRWPVLLEKAEQTPKLDKPEDDASRLYLIAVAHEAQAYDARREAFELERRRISGSGDPKQEETQEGKLFQSAKGHLEDAARFYRDAIAGDRKEKEFKKPEGRIEEAVRLYATIERQRNEYEANLKKKTETETAARSTTRKNSKAAGPPPAPNQGVTAPTTAEAGSSNAEILKLCGAHLDEPTVLGFVQDAPAPNFDLSANSLIALKNTCGTSYSKYVAAMRTKMIAKGRTSSAARSKTVRTKPGSPAK